MLQLRKFFSSSRAAREQTPAAVSRKSGFAPHVAADSSRTGAAIAEAEKHFNAGRLAEALAIVDDALASAPNDATLLFARASTLFAWGRYLEALESFERVRAIGPGNLDLDLQLGWTYLTLQRVPDAETCFRQAVAREPDSERAWVALANVLEIRGTLATHAAQFARTLSRWPRNYEGLMLLAACRGYLGDHESAAAVFREAIELDPTRSRAWSNLGVALGWSERYDEGLEALQRAFDIDTANGANDSVLNFATSLREDGHIAKSLEILEANLVHNPDPRVHWLRSVILLECGRYAEGWVQHEFRWMKEPLASTRWTLRRPVWDGQDVRGKTIMLRPEQGFGDAIQFIRYAKLLKEMGARVIFDAFKDFNEISHDFDDVDEVTREGPMPEFDYHVPLLSLPRILGTTVDSIPSHVPYVKVRPSYGEKWADRIRQGAKLKIGLVWAGNPKHIRDRLRSVPLERLAPLARIEGVQFYSLQKGPTSAADIAASTLDIIDLGSDFENFCDTAAAIRHLDLVISVDTSVAHLAGALAKPVWLMIANPPDWRWLLEGDRTAWYPTMRLFRQRVRNRWDPVVEEIGAALRNFALSRDRRPVSSGETFDVALEEAPRASAAAESRAEGPTSALCRVAETRYGIVQYSPKDERLAESLRYYGEFVYSQLALMGRFIRPGSWLLEVGAGIGVNTLFMAESAAREGHVIAYEADPVLHQLARQNLNANRVGNVTLLCRDIAGVIEGRTRSAGRAGSASADTIDQLRLHRLDWIRISDAARCAGILSGATATLWRHRPWLFVSAVTEDEVDACESAVRDYGYQARRLCTPLFRPDNYNRRTDDIFDGASALALLCVPEEVDMDIELQGGAGVAVYA